jgi:uncharacterized SAM-binding protein YcdF (DUF218 family)
LKVTPAISDPHRGLRPAAIVVLGARVLADGRPSAALLRRMQVAVSLYQAGVAPLLVLSGGGRHAMPEAAVMRELALAGGVPAAALMIEPRSRTTLENATETAKLMASRGPVAVVLVTDSYHALRARLLFRMAGLTVVAVHTARVPMRPRLLMTAAEGVKLPINLLRALVRKARGNAR